MAISGSLNFLNASLTGSENINVDFVGMNTIVVDPISSTLNRAGHLGTRPLSFYGNASFNEDGFIETVDMFNSLILNRNGPYQHAMWQQYRGGAHPIARALRMNNTMSIDINQPDPLQKHMREKAIQARKESVMGGSLATDPLGAYLYNSYPGANTLDHINVTSSNSPELFSDLQNHYEPCLISKYKPFVYSVQVGSPDGQKSATARASFMNQIKFFTNDKINSVMNIASGDIVSASADHKNFDAPKHSFYEVLGNSKAYGATNFVYSERIFPRSVNAYRAFKLERPDYEESAGTLAGFDRKFNRSFWRSDQGGGSDLAAAGTTRLRTDGKAINFASITQETQIIHGAAPLGGSTSRPIIAGHLIATHGGTSLVFSSSLAPVKYLENGIVVNQQYTLSSSGRNNVPLAPGNLHPGGFSANTFAQLESYQPYNISLLSMWPLDPRQDIYDKPFYLTSSIGGQGLQIGLTPHKAGIVPSTGVGFGSPESLADSSTASDTTAISASIMNLETGSAGELVYSTKPTIFFYRTGSLANVQYDGYTAATASLQYHRHTFPYNTPFFATHKVRQRDPMYNSYSDFTQEGLKYFGRDYSIIPEFRISDNFEYYYKHFFGDKLDENPYLYNTSLTEEPASGGTKKKILRKTWYGGELSSLIHKLDFLRLEGALPSASSDDDNLFTSDATKQVYGWDPLLSTPLHELANPVHSYAQSPTAVSFYEKYSHTDDLVDFSHVMQAPNGFKFGEKTVPTKINFTCHGIRKLLPYNGFFPVTRTAQVGGHFVDFITPRVGDWTSHPNNSQEDKLPGYLQAFIEPFFGPGLLYNSIKSGIAVEYPVYTNDPYYYAPHSFISSSHGLHTRSAHPAGSTSYYSTPGSDFRFQLEASQSFTYGGFQMVGSSRCIPSILNSRPETVLPFEALYDPLNYLEAFGNKPVRLVTDFVDLDRNTPFPNTSASVYTAAGYTTRRRLRHPGIVQGTRENSHPAASFINLASKTDKTSALYVSSINNFLCETMEFFLSDGDVKGVKLPVATSAIVNAKQITVSTFSKYYMDVSLNMGLHQVMCEGPRDAGIGGGRGVENDFVGDYNNAKMRGYIYGPPLEIVPHFPGNLLTDYDPSGRTATFHPSFNARPHRTAAGALVFNTASVAVADYESYFGANLQDPAYQAYTPPYFYGESAMILSFGNSETAAVEFQEIFSETSQNSIELKAYNTGSGFGRDLIGLCKTSPHTASIASGSMTRMGIEASVDIFNEPISLEDPNGDNDKTKHIWYIAPKWVCPVLDFSSSVSAVKVRQPIRTIDKTGNKNSYYSFITNSFHDNTTGKGMWGGYGTDPYDLSAMESVYENMGRDNNRIADTSLAEKGIYLEIKNSFTNQAQTRDLTKRNFATEVDTSFAVDQSFEARAFDTLEMPGAVSGSLADLLGFESRKYEIGKMASEKSISEAVILIPYFEEPIDIRINVEQSINHSEEDSGTNIISGHTDEIFSTREVIPGKHFLPIHETAFENALSVILSSRWYGEETDYMGSGQLQDVLSSDIGKMINSLIGEPDSIGRTTRKGYQLPPEFDFIHNNKVKPFQMIVMPLRDTLSKQDLIDIYQGVMPDASREVKKIKSEKIAVSPSSTSTVESPEWHVHAYASAAPRDISDELSLNNFLTPVPCLTQNPFYSQLQTLKLFNPDLATIPGWLTDSPSARQFYKKLKFMVFKVKQQAEKDYETYRKKQIAKVIKQKVTSDGRGLKLPPGFEEVLKNKKFSEVYGTNWPYDYFSLVESIKIDIEMEVNE